MTIYRPSCLTLLSLTLLVAGCQALRPKPEPPLPPLPPPVGNTTASPRVNGAVGAPNALPAPVIIHGAGAPPAARPPGVTAPSGSYMLDFADTDIREIVAQILGKMLGQSYTIDPGVHGNVTLHTAEPIPGNRLLPTLESLLASTNAVLVQSDGLWRVVQAASAAGAGSRVVPLRYASAEDLAKVLQPIAGTGTHVVADPALNALVISGDAGQVDGLLQLISSFDVDALAGQSYAVLPVEQGNARDFADAMREAFKGRGGANLANVVRVVPMAHLNAVLVVASEPRYLEQAQNIWRLVDRERRETSRGWQVRYLQNSNANDVAYTLQMAFTPNNVTAKPEAQGPNAARIQRALSGGISGIGGGGIGGGGIGGGGIGAGSFGGGLGAPPGLGGGTSGLAALGGANPLSPAAPAGPGPTPEATAPPGNPLLGGLEAGGGGGGTPDSMRILPDPQNNAILIYGTRRETETVLAMVNKVDILPMQVRIDAVIAEVTLNHALQYGTQWWLHAGGLNAVLNNGLGTAAGPVGDVVNTVLGTTYPSFIIGGGKAGGAPLVLQALQTVTHVDVLSSPQLTVVDNQTARMQVGSLVPYLTQSSQSTITSNAPIVNSIGYQPTGVILEVTPRVNSGGLVTLDITQEVSDVNTAASATNAANGISSPTFDERNVSSRVVVQDGQTLGLAGLIQDSNTKGNSGIPFIKDVPILGLLASTQNNTRIRTELLIMLTPHVIRDQNAVRAAAEDMREVLHNAAELPYTLNGKPLEGSADPNQPLRNKIDNQMNRWFGQ